MNPNTDAGKGAVVFFIKYDDSRTEDKDEGGTSERDKPWRQINDTAGSERT